ncbi:MAG: sigma-70 family RNA polymerase sigma factor [Myxococcota bacterium]
MAASSTKKGLDLSAAYEAHADHVWRLLQRMGIPIRHVPDLVQEVFLILCRREHELEDSSLKGLLWQITRGLAANHRRSHAHRRVVLGEAPEQADAHDPEATLDARRRVAHAHAAIEALDEAKRAVFVMFEAEAMSCKRIAAELDLPLGTVHSRLHAARRAILAALAETDPSEKGVSDERLGSN